MSEREVSLSEAQERLPELLDAVERGDTLAITRNGKQVARITPAETNGANPDTEETPEEALARRTAVVEEFLRESDNWEPIPVTVDEILEWIREGRAKFRVRS